MNNREGESPSLKLKAMSRKKLKINEKGEAEYYILPTDMYGQPSGCVRSVMMTPDEAEKRREKGEYIYSDYIEALYRSQD
jgi:hypothetical protein